MVPILSGDCAGARSLCPVAPAPYISLSCKACDVSAYSGALRHWQACARRFAARMAAAKLGIGATAAHPLERRPRNWERGI